MLFLLGLFCFAETVTVTVIANDGTLFEEVSASRTPVSNEKMKGAAVYIVGRDGKIISTGRLKSKVSVQAVSASFDFIEKKIPTQQWRGEQVEVLQVEIFSTEGCRFCKYAKADAYKTFGEKNVKIYKVDDDNKPAHKIKSQAILKAAGQPNFPTVPIVSVIGKNGVRYFLGGYDQLMAFIKSNRAASMAPQAFSDVQADATKYLTLDVQTKKWNREKFNPIQIEIVGTKTCPYCVQAKKLAGQTFGKEKIQEYNSNDRDYWTASEKIMNAAGIYNYAYIPRISVIAMIDGNPVRFVLGGYSEFERFVKWLARVNRG